MAEYKAECCKKAFQSGLYEGIKQGLTNKDRVDVLTRIVKEQNKRLEAGREANKELLGMLEIVRAVF